ncbi:unnamed protein product [Paramecium pentaurelia]|uniref:Uncharacterized protein n=1 Tax=Paramecium pentaurelia TaxID=43138 RepID=A0A8S1RWL6_9CILI|nr:unnamed protein product [Paramecium pentaurelia]
MGSNTLNLLVEMKADLKRCNLNGSELDNVDIRGVNLNGAMLFNCKWKNLKIKGLNKLHGHRNKVCSVCFSPDGNTLTFGNSDDSISIQDNKKLNYIQYICEQLVCNIKKQKYFIVCWQQLIPFIFPYFIFNQLVLQIYHPIHLRGLISFLQQRKISLFWITYYGYEYFINNLGQLHNFIMNKFSCEIELDDKFIKQIQFQSQNDEGYNFFQYINQCNLKLSSRCP